MKGSCKGGHCSVILSDSLYWLLQHAQPLRPLSAKAALQDSWPLKASSGSSLWPPQQSCLPSRGFHQQQVPMSSVVKELADERPGLPVSVLWVHLGATMGLCTSHYTGVATTLLLPDQWDQVLRFRGGRSRRLCPRTPQTWQPVLSAHISTRLSPALTLATCANSVLTFSSYLCSDLRSLSTFSLCPSQKLRCLGTHLCLPACLPACLPF